MWFCVAVILSAWALVEDWEVVDGSLDSIEKMLEVVSSRLPNKAAQIAAGTMGWIFLTALKVNMDSALHDAMPVLNVQRCLEELEQHIFASEQNPVALKNPASLTVKQ